MDSGKLLWNVVNRVLANFGKHFTNFVAKATKVNHGKLTKIIYLLHPLNPLLDGKISQIFLTLQF